VSLREWLGFHVRTDEHIVWSNWLILVTATYLLLGVAALAGYSVTGNPTWVESFFRIPGALLALFLAVTALWFNLQVLGHYEQQEPMHVVWLMISGAAGFEVAGVTFSQVLAAESPLNPLTHISWWSAATATMIRQYGLLLGGTCRFTLLAIALVSSVRIYRRNKLLGHLKVMDRILWLLMGAFVIKEYSEIVKAWPTRRFPAVEIAGFPVDLLLWICLTQAMLLYRSAHQMGPGWITRCWNAFAVGAFLICVGVVSDWATRWGYIVWPWNAITWYIWLPAGAAFALAPIYQLEAIQHAIADRKTSRA
jgi:hypothetical protein